ncbi:Arv1-like protein [Ramicandelaber brevisporus]|nr:Arv1-like protein [Ramicandelaber brevisporus]
MPHCVECGAVTQSLYTEYSRGNIRLTQCSRCGKFADKYVENDFVIAFLDLILHRPQVYRHLLLNVLDREHAFTTEIGKLAVLQALFDVYVKLLKYEEAIDASAAAAAAAAAANAIIPSTSSGWASTVPSTCHFGYMDGASVTGCVEQIGQIFHGLLATERSIAQNPSLRQMAAAMVLSSFGLLLVILMVIWKMQKNPHRMLLDLFVFTSRGQALAVIYGRRYQVCFVALLSAMMMRTFMLKAVVSFAMNLF